MAAKEFLITGPHTGEGPMLLCMHAPNVYHALMSVFAARSNREYTESEPKLEPVIARVDPASNLVIGRFIAPRDTIFYQSPGTEGGTALGLVDEGAWVQGTRLYSPAVVSEADNIRQNIDGEQTLILESLDTHGDPLEPGLMVGIEVNEAAMSGLFVATRNHIPLAPDGSMPALLFNPSFYAHE